MERTPKWELKDPDMRPLLFDHYELNGDRLRFFEELCIGKTRADALLVYNDSLTGFEIKSDRDSLERLEKQMKDYNRFCNFIYLVTGSKLLEKSMELIPEYWGIYHIFFDENHELHMELVREATISKKFRLHNQLKLLWRSELIPLVRKYKLGGVSGKNKQKLIRMLETNLEKPLLQHEVCEILMERDYSIYDEEDE